MSFGMAGFIIILKLKNPYADIGLCTLLGFICAAVTLDKK